MKQQNDELAVERCKPIAALILSWVIILGTYLLFRLVFLIFGLHLYVTVLGGCLAIIPYTLAAIYLWRSKTSSKMGFYVLGIMFPAIVEKIILYLFGAFLYGMNPGNIAGVMAKIAQKEPFTNFITTPFARYVFEISFFGRPYILGSLIVCVLLISLIMGVSKNDET